MTIQRLEPPSVVLDAIEAAAEARPVSWRHVVAGHTHAEKWVVTLDDGRSVFAKAGSAESARRQIDRERAILDEVRAPFMPRLYGSSTGDGWTTLVLEDLSAAQWPPPYLDGGDALLEAVAAVATRRRPLPSRAARPDDHSARTGSESARLPSRCWRTRRSRRYGWNAACPN